MRALNRGALIHGSLLGGVKVIQKRAIGDARNDPMENDHCLTTDGSTMLTHAPTSLNNNKPAQEWPGVAPPIAYTLQGIASVHASGKYIANHLPRHFINALTIS